MAPKPKFIQDVPDRVIVLEQFAKHGRSPKALVECPDCGVEFLRERACIRSSGHTLCRSCIQRGPRPERIKPIENIPEQIIVLEQVAEIDPRGHHKALVQCPDCNSIYLKQRGAIREHGHTICFNCAQRRRCSLIKDTKYIIVLEQFAESGHNLKALVQCPFCDKVFLKQRSAIRPSEHTACRRCARRYLAPGAVFIEDIPGQLVVLEQYLDELAPCGRAMMLIQCPNCGLARKVTRQQVMNIQSSLCQSCNQTGERNWRWNGGHSPNYGPHWNRLSQSIMERDGQACRLCGGTARDGRLHVHHIIPYRETQDNSPENLITLCPRCHCWADHHLDESVPLLSELTQNK